MATRGVWQLTKLRMVYCEVGGSSQVVRDFIQKGRIVDWARQNPQVDVIVQIRNGHHPYIRGHYLTGPEQQVGVKNEPTKTIYTVLNKLRDRSGRKITKLKKPIRTDTPSVQGVWTPMLDLQGTTFPFKVINSESDSDDSNSP